MTDNNQNDGWVLVPRTPPRDMLDAGNRAARACVGSELSDDEMDIAVWDAMLSAAPVSPTPPDAREGRIAELEAKLNTPELHDFAAGVVLEAAHQRERWSADHDAGKAPADWFWLLGYLGQKAMTAHAEGNVEKALHHTISTAAMLANWHAAITGANIEMRPGIADPEARALLTKDKPHAD